MKSLAACLLACVAIAALAADAPSPPVPPTPPLPAWAVKKSAALGRAIERVEYQGKPAYYVAPACCDIPSELYDAAGQLLCYPDGGIAGGDGRCPTFSLRSPQRQTASRDGRWAAEGPASAPVAKPASGP